MKPAITLAVAALFLGRASFAAEPPPATALSAGAGQSAARGGTKDPAARPLLSRADLPALKLLDRAEVFAALGSFDDRGLSEAEFVGRTSRFQFAPGTLRLANGTACTGFADANLLLRTVPTAPFAVIHVESGQENPRGGWYSDSYGRIEPAPVLVQSLRTRLPWRAATRLFPYRGTTPPEVALSFDGWRAGERYPEAGDVSVACSPP